MASEINMPIDNFRFISKRLICCQINTTLFE
jgi:hypothetical protein